MKLNPLPRQFRIARRKMAMTLSVSFAWILWLVATTREFFHATMHIIHGMSLAKFPASSIPPCAYDASSAHHFHNLPLLRPQTSSCIRMWLQKANRCPCCMIPVIAPPRLDPYLPPVIQYPRVYAPPNLSLLSRTRFLALWTFTNGPPSETTDSPHHHMNAVQSRNGTDHVNPSNTSRNSRLRTSTRPSRFTYPQSQSTPPTNQPEPIGSGPFSLSRGGRHSPVLRQVDISSPSHRIEAPRQPPTSNLPNPRAPTSLDLGRHLRRSQQIDAMQEESVPTVNPQ